MSEANTQETRNEISEEQERLNEEAEREKIRQTAEKAVEIASKGTMALAAPLYDGEKEIHELEYDFLKLKGLEMADAIDSASAGDGNPFELTNRQALALFAAAAGKEHCPNNGLMRKEIQERLGIRDAINAMRIARLFFVASVRAANFLSTKTSSR